MLALSASPFSQAFAQSDPNSAGLAFNRNSAALNNAFHEAKLRGKGSGLELVDDQKLLIMALFDRHQAIIREAKEDESPESRERLFQKTEELEKELTSKILLPHQVKFLNAKVFSQFLKGYQGSVLNAILVYYKDQLGISTSQKSKLDILQKDISKKVDEAREKFRLEMEKIANEAQEGMDAVFTENQRLQLQELRGEAK